MGIVHEMLRFEKQNRLILEFLNLIAIWQIYQNVLAHLLNPYLHRIGNPLHEVADSACALFITCGDIQQHQEILFQSLPHSCLLYTSDAADEL